MSPKKISPAIPLAVGVLCIGAALVGGVVAYMEEAEAEKKPKAKTTAESPVRRLKKAKRLPVDMARQKKEGTSQSNADRLEKAINENMLLLGKVYHQAAAREVIDREKHQLYADQAFYLLAMIYQRAKSGEALNVMREVNDIQRDYLYRLARVNWKRAQLAMAAGEADKADESFFTATQRYLQAMSQAVEGKREEIAVEFAILKREIAKWKSRDQSADAAAETQL